VKLFTLNSELMHLVIRLLAWLLTKANQLILHH